MHTLSYRPSLEHLLSAYEPDSQVKEYMTAVRPTQLLLAAVGGVERLARLKMLYDRARPRQSRRAPGILTAEEVFQGNARKDGYSNKGIAMFIDEFDLWSDV